MTDEVSPSSTGEPNRWAKKIQDIIADSANLREGLSDDEAMALIDWGAARAVQLGDRLAQPEHANITEEQVEDIGYALVRLMTRIAWVVVYRGEKDADWLTRTFHKINDLSLELDGSNAPQLLDEELTNWIGQHVIYNNSQLIRDLITRMTPTLASAKQTLLGSIPTDAGTVKPPDAPAPLSSILADDGTIKPPDEPPKPAPLSSILDSDGSIKKSPPLPQGDQPDEQ